MEDDHKPSIKQQRRLNPNMQEVFKKAILRLRKVDITYPISNSKWVSLVHVVPKKDGMAVIKNENNELIPTIAVIDWRMCIDCRKLNKATCEDQFFLHFIYQMLERLATNSYSCYLDGYSGFF